MSIVEVKQNLMLVSSRRVHGNKERSWMHIGKRKSDKESLPLTILTYRGGGAMVAREAHNLETLFESDVRNNKDLL